MPLYIPNLKTFDGKSGRKESYRIISSIDYDITGTLKITNQGFIDTTGTRLKIDGQITEISKADLDKLYESTYRVTNVNKVAIVR